MTVLLDANVLIAALVADHVHHGAAQEWLAGLGELPAATCPITQGAFVRLAIRHGASAQQAVRVLGGFTRAAAREFWADDRDFGDVALRGVVGHRQVTDAYLAALARSRGARLATFDRGLADLHPDVALLVPAGPTADE